MPMMKFFSEAVNVFQWFTTFAKNSAIDVWHNPKYASDIFLTIFTTVLLDCLKQSYQIFGKAIFQDVSEDLILSYNLISLFPSI